MNMHSARWIHAIGLVGLLSSTNVLSEQQSSAPASPTDGMQSGGMQHGGMMGGMQGMQHGGAGGGMMGGMGGQQQGMAGMQHGGMGAADSQQAGGMQGMQHGGSGGGMGGQQQGMAGMQHGGMGAADGQQAGGMQGMQHGGAGGGMMGSMSEKDQEEAWKKLEAQDIRLGELRRQIREANDQSVRDKLKGEHQAVLKEQLILTHKLMMQEHMKSMKGGMSMGGSAAPAPVQPANQ